MYSCRQAEARKREAEEEQRRQAEARAKSKLPGEILVSLENPLPSIRLAAITAALEWADTADQEGIAVLRSKLGQMAKTDNSDSVKKEARLALEKLARNGALNGQAEAEAKRQAEEERRRQAKAERKEQFDWFSKEIFGTTIDAATNLRAEKHKQEGKIQRLAQQEKARVETNAGAEREYVDRTLMSFPQFWHAAFAVLIVAAVIIALQYATPHGALWILIAAEIGLAIHSMFLFTRRMRGTAMFLWLILAFGALGIFSAYERVLLFEELFR